MKRKRILIALLVLITAIGAGIYIFKDYKDDKAQRVIESAKIEVVLEDSLKCYNSENVEEYLNTLDVPDREKARRNIEDGFRRYNYEIKVLSKTVDVTNDKEASIKVEQEITDLSLPSDNVQIIKSRILLRKVNNEWKIYKTEKE